MKPKWIVALWIIAIFIMVSPLHNALANSSHSEKIEYTKSQLTPTLEQGAKKIRCHRLLLAKMEGMVTKVLLIKRSVLVRKSYRAQQMGLKVPQSSLQKQHPKLWIQLQSIGTIVHFLKSH